MEFIPLYFGDRLTVINPHGTIGVVTLWSKVDYVIDRFRQAGVDLDPATSPIAVFGTLYGNGLREMLRNLLYNPQIRVLLICGHDRSGSRDELHKFFELGLERVDSPLVCYRSPHPPRVVAPARIRKTKRIIDDLGSPGAVCTSPRVGGTWGSAAYGSYRRYKAILCLLASNSCNLGITPGSVASRSGGPIFSQQPSGSRGGAGYTH